MKLHFFHLMPYRFLPDDFTEKHRSVWVDVDSELLTRLRGARSTTKSSTSSRASDDFLSECAHMPMIEKPEESVSLVTDVLSE